MNSKPLLFCWLKSFHLVRVLTVGIDLVHTLPVCVLKCSSKDVVLYIYFRDGVTGVVALTFECVSERDRQTGARDAVVIVLRWSQCRWFSLGSVSASCECVCVCRSAYTCLCMYVCMSGRLEGG